MCIEESDDENSPIRTQELASPELIVYETMMHDAQNKVNDAMHDARWMMHDVIYLMPYTWCKIHIYMMEDAQCQKMCILKSYIVVPKTLNSSGLSSKSMQNSSTPLVSMQSSVGSLYFSKSWTILASAFFSESLQRTCQKTIDFVNLRSTQCILWNPKTLYTSINE